MKTFQQYMEDVELPGAPSIDSSNNSYNEPLLKVINLAAKKYRTELIDFLGELGKKDIDIQREVDNLRRHDLNRPMKIQDKAPKQDEKDVVIPHDSDGVVGIEPNT